MSPQQTPVREPAVAGQFYPADPGALRAAVDALLSRAETCPPADEIVAMVAPHAGYTFSGAVAAAAYRAIEGRSFDAVVVLGPSHREAFEGISVYASGAYRTPLGAAPVEESLAGRLLDQIPEARAGGEGHRVSPPSFSLAGLRGEHAIEVHVPFLQQVLPDLHIVPVVMGDADPDLCRRLGLAIAEVSRGRRVLVLASSDLYHGASYKACLRTDSETLDRIRAFNPEAFVSGIEEGACQACGSAPITAAMVAARRMGATRAAIVSRGNSGDITGEREGYVVGYGAVLFYREAAPPPASGPQAGTALLPGAREQLLRVARSAIRASLAGEPAPGLGAIPEPLRARRGVFVTLKLSGELRGCIGQVEPHRPLAQAVQEVAVAAARRDPRFAPLTEDELENVRVEISVLTPPRRISRLEEIQVGTHGVLISHPDGSGLLLPQVASERGWNRETFLAQACQKAGLPRKAFRDPKTEIQVFSAEVFSEDPRARQGHEPHPF